MAQKRFRSKNLILIMKFENEDGTEPVLVTALLKKYRRIQYDPGLCGKTV